MSATQPAGAGMSLEELDAALRAAMDDDWDDAPPPAREAAKPSQPPEATQPPAALEDPAAIDAALRAAMDDDWEGVQRPVAPPTMAPPAAGPQHGRSLGYLSLPDAAAASLLGASVDPGFGDDDFYSLPPLDDGCYSLAPPDRMDTAVPAPEEQQLRREP